MEKKICSYTENNERLQLVALWRDNGVDLLGYEIRANRVLISRFPPEDALKARLVMYHCVHEICINRSKAMLKLT